MRRWLCEKCAAEVSFESSECARCGEPLGYLPAQRTIRVLARSDAVSFSVGGDVATYWRCLNAAWGCNWMLPAASDASWCRSCALTRNRPDVGRPDAIVAWCVAEASKRRLVHQLDELALPIEPRSEARPMGLAFDLAHVPGHPGLTGHLEGLVTIDLAEADERHRDDLRRQLDEPFRTLIGNLRHEIGHHYWHRLVGQSDHLARFRSLFGDEGVDYEAALQHHYATLDRPAEPERFVSKYAQAHPYEDWAETFAHYLHIVDATDTAAAHGFSAQRREQSCSARSLPELTVGELLDRWRPLGDAVNAIAESLGGRPVYPFQLRGMVVDKLEFVHDRVTEHSQREQFYTQPVDSVGRTKEQPP
ncbi:MAG: zinc-binding metallopeptidase family protein [Ilumatobacteraceae bacterium]